MKYLYPKLFYQIYSVHEYKNGYIILLVYALLPGKSENVHQYFGIVFVCHAHTDRFNLSLKQYILTLK